MYPPDNYSKGSVATPFDQLSFIMRVHRSFGLERCGRKNSHRTRFHTNVLKKWIYDVKHNGMSHIYVGNDDINIYDNDEILINKAYLNTDKDKDKDNNENKDNINNNSDNNSTNDESGVIGKLKANDKIFIYFNRLILNSKSIIGLRTMDDKYGYILVPSAKVFQNVKVKYSETIKHIEENNIIISRWQSNL